MKVMTKAQLNAALKVINADCKATGQMIDDDGLTCAVAALGLAAGVSKKRVKNDNLTEWEDTIEKKFGIPTSRIGEIMETNDNEETVPKRRKSVAKLIKEIFAELRREYAS